MSGITEPLMSQLILPEALAERLNVTIETLRNWRNDGVGPNYVKLTNTPKGRVRYRMSDVLAWEQSLATHYQNVQKKAEEAYDRI